MKAAALQRYQEIVPRWEEFLDAVERPEPVTLRVRRALTGTDALIQTLGERGFRVESVPGLPDYLRVLKGPESVAQTLEHWLGLFHVQQAVMALPSLALAPAPGDRVLDLCAAPGGKTTHLAELMEDRGPLVATDPKEKRLRGLMGNVFRLGHSNVLVIAADGRELPEGALFDRVLVDAPCSAEGNIRRKGKDSGSRTGRFQRYVTSLQEALLRRAVTLARPGGVVVYATCTFAPEENEGVVDAVVRDLPVRIESIELDLPHAPGLTSWAGRRFVPGLERAWRVYPHHLDSGGMFMARIRKAGPEERPAGGEGGWHPIPPAFPGDDEGEALARIRTARTLLVQEYGMDPEVVGTLDWMVRGENIWLQTAGEWPVESWRAHGGWRVVAAGLRAFRGAGPGRETPSNHFLTRFRNELGGSRRRELTRGELKRLLGGEALDPGTLPTGPVVLYRDGTLLGRGMVGRGGLRSEIPGAQADRLSAVLAATGS